MTSSDSSDPLDGPSWDSVRMFPSFANESLGADSSGQSRLQPSYPLSTVPPLTIDPRVLSLVGDWSNIPSHTEGPIQDEMTDIDFVEYDASAGVYEPRMQAEYQGGRVGQDEDDHGHNTEAISEYDSDEGADNNFPLEGSSMNPEYGASGWDSRYNTLTAKGGPFSYNPAVPNGNDDTTSFRSSPLPTHTKHVLEGRYYDQPTSDHEAYTDSSGHLSAGYNGYSFSSSMVHAEGVDDSEVDVTGMTSHDEAMESDDEDKPASDGLPRQGHGFPTQAYGSSDEPPHHGGSYQYRSNDGSHYSVSSRHHQRPYPDHQLRSGPFSSQADSRASIGNDDSQSVDQIQYQWFQAYQRSPVNNESMRDWTDGQYLPGLQKNSPYIPSEQLLRPLHQYQQPPAPVHVNEDYRASLTFAGRHPTYGNHPPAVTQQPGPSYTYYTDGAANQVEAGPSTAPQNSNHLLYNTSIPLRPLPIDGQQAHHDMRVRNDEVEDGSQDVLHSQAIARMEPSRIEQAATQSSSQEHVCSQCPKSFGTSERLQ